jgi:hypothetical protein
MDPRTGELRPTWDEAMDRAAERGGGPAHVVRFGNQLVARGVLTGQPQTHKLIGYLTKYLQIVGRVAPAGHRRRPRPPRPANGHAAVGAVLSHVRELGAVRGPAQERPARPMPRRLQGRGAPAA